MASYANSDAQDTFCKGTDCSVIRFFDQTKHGHHLDLAPVGGAGNKTDIGVNASKHKIMIGGHSVYGAYFEGSMGYRCESTWGVATGDVAETLYMVVNGKHCGR